MPLKITNLKKGVIQIEASLIGMGGCWGNRVYKLDFPLGFEQLGIVQLEMLNVFLALRVRPSVESKLYCF